MLRALVAMLLVLSFAVAMRLDHRSEVARIQAHLERAERALLARDVSGLSPSQRAARERNILALRAYRLRGQFPHNHDFQRRTPYFIDRHGTRCAMAHLIELAGGGEIVRRVAATANNARIHELAADRELCAWLDREGLTLAEAARIQPGYGSDPEVAISDDWQPLYGVATVCATTFATAAIVLNEQEPSEMSLFTRRDRADFAIAMGILCLGLGVPALNAPTNGSQGLGALNLAIGALSFAVGIAGARSPEPAEDKPTVSAARFSLAAAPYAGRQGSGVALALRF